MRQGHKLERDGVVSSEAFISLQILTNKVDDIVNTNIDREIRRYIRTLTCNP